MNVDLPYPFDQYSGDLLCPLCGEPLEISIERTEHGAEPVSRCAECMTLTDIG